MPEQLLLAPESEQNPAVASSIGELAIEEASQPNHAVRIGEYAVITNIPEGAIGFADDKKDDQAVFGIAPKALDSLPAGSYGAETRTPAMGYKSEDHSVPNQEVSAQQFVIRDTDNGRVFETEDRFSEGWHNIRLQGMTQFTESLGYEVTRESDRVGYIEAFPTPETVKAKAKKYGVDIELVPEWGKIDGKEYLGVFADGKYPVSTFNQENYLHDIYEDHLTAMIFGGEELRDALQEVATEALKDSNPGGESHKDLIDRTAINIDAFTSSLRDAVVQFIGVRGIEEFDPDDQEMIERYEDTAIYAGLSREQARKILDAAVARADKLPIDKTRTLDQTQQIVQRARDSIKVE